MSLLGRFARPITARIEARTNLIVERLDAIDLRLQSLESSLREVAEAASEADLHLGHQLRTVRVQLEDIRSL